MNVQGDSGTTPAVINLTGTVTATAEPQLSLSSTSMDLGTVTVGTKASSNLILSNSGTADLIISMITLSGTEFGISGIATPPDDQCRPIGCGIGDFLSERVGNRFWRNLHYKQRFHKSNYKYRVDGRRHDYRARSACREPHQPEFWKRGCTEQCFTEYYADEYRKCGRQDFQRDGNRRRIHREWRYRANDSESVANRRAVHEVCADERRQCNGNNHCYKQWQRTSTSHRVDRNRYSSISRTIDHESGEREFWKRWFRKQRLAEHYAYQFG